MRVHIPYASAVDISKRRSRTSAHSSGTHSHSTHAAQQHGARAHGHCSGAYDRTPYCSTYKLYSVSRKHTFTTPCVRNARPRSPCVPLGVARRPATPESESDRGGVRHFLPSRRFPEAATRFVADGSVQPGGLFHDGGALSRCRQPASVGSRYRPEQECATPLLSTQPVLTVLPAARFFYG